jgi:hypothetical protein
MDGRETLRRLAEQDRKRELEEARRLLEEAELVAAGPPDPGDRRRWNRYLDLISEPPSRETPAPQPQPQPQPKPTTRNAMMDAAQQASWDKWLKAHLRNLSDEIAREVIVVEKQLRGEIDALRREVAELRQREHVDEREPIDLPADWRTGDARQVQ